MPCNSFNDKSNSYFTKQFPIKLPKPLWKIYNNNCNKILSPTIDNIILNFGSNTIEYINATNINSTNINSTNIYTDNLVITSDITLKTNIFNIENTRTDNLLLIKPKIYNYINNEKKEHYGFIAQEFEEYYPELIQIKDNKKHINYIELIPLLVSKIQLMQQQINTLENTIFNYNKL
jgi:hypothetical protein